MIYSDTAEINGKEYKCTYSDTHYIERGGEVYFQAVDPPGTDRSYTESTEEFTQEEIENSLLPQIARAGINALSLGDDVSLKLKSYYPIWQELTEQGFTAEKSGYKFTYGGDLYKTVKANQQFLPNWVPGQGTESIFERIDETHTGTKDDPIPYKVNMTVYADKYYTEDGILYRCTRDSGIPLQHNASVLVGHYFETVSE